MARRRVVPERVCRRCRDLRDDPLVVLVRLFHLRHRDRNRGVWRHSDLLGEEGVVVVYVPPIYRAGRYVALLIGATTPIQKLVLVCDQNLASSR